MNQTQIKAVENHLISKVRAAFAEKKTEAQKKGEAVAYKDMEVLATKLATLQKEAEALNKKHEHDEDVCPYIENTGVSKYGTSSYAKFVFQGGDHKALNKEESKAIAKVNDFVLELTLGQATLADVEKFLATLLK